MTIRAFIVSAALVALALGSGCKFPYPPDVNDDGRPSTDAGTTDGRPIDAPAPVPLIAFTSDRTGNDDIFTMHVDGSVPINLTNSPAADTDALWSPTGERIAFLSTRSGVQELYVMNEDGTAVTNVSRGPAELPTWAPDGSRIAFSSTRSGQAQLYIGGVDGSQPVQLTTESTTGTYLEADWSPSVGRLAYTIGDRLLVINADGSGRRSLSTGMTYAGPRWSPDGHRISFLSRPNLFWELFAIDEDGNNLTNLTNTPMTHERDPRWSPAGDVIAIVVDVAGSSEIATVTVPGGGRADRTMTPGADAHPRWSNDGALILFESAGDVLTVPGVGPRTSANLTRHPSLDRQAVWRPSR